MTARHATSSHHRPRRLRLAVGLGLAGVGAAAVALNPPMWPVSLGLAVAIPVVDRVTVRKPGAKARKKDVRVGQLLGTLERYGYRVMLNVPLRRRTADYVVMGPSGTYVVTLNAQPGRYRLTKAGWLTYNGRTVADVVGEGSTRVAETKRILAEHGVKSPVQSLVALTATSLPDGAIDMGNVKILEAADLPAYIKHGPERLAADQVLRIATALTPRRESQQPRQRHDARVSAAV
jgi:hypothetical protein